MTEQTLPKYRQDHDFISGPRDYHRADAPLVCRRCDRTEEEHDTAQEPRREPRRWEEVLAPSYTSEPASERSQRLPRPRWLDRAAKDMTGSLKVDR